MHRVPERQWLSRGVDAGALYGTVEYCDNLPSNSHDGATDCLCGVQRRLDLCDFDFSEFFNVLNVYGFRGSFGFAFSAHMYVML